MTSKIIDGKATAQLIQEMLKSEISALKLKPGLTAILVGENPASKIYISTKEKACAEVGIKFKKFTFREKVLEEDLISLIKKLNKDKKVHGVLVQLPLPKHISEQKVLDSIKPAKDVDGLGTFNAGKLLLGEKGILPATPKGVMKLLESTGINLEGKHAVVLGRSNLVGKPLSLLLQRANCTVTMCHSKTRNLAEITKQADILVSAVGKTKTITAEMVKRGAVVVDVGINWLENGHITGDVDFDAVKEIASFITPVPGGVGPMTVACLLENVVEAAKSI